MGSQGGNPEQVAAALAGAMLIAAIIGAVIGLGILAVICWLVSSCYQVIPQQFRRMEPGMVWLLLIPCFNLVWLFFVFPRLPQSFKAYFDSIGRTDVEDCGEKLGWAYAICVVCGIIPLVGYLAGPASLVLLIIYLIKVMGLKKQVLEQVQA